MSRQGFTGGDLVDASPASHTAVNTTVAATNLWVPSLWTPIPALDLKPGKVYVLRAGGIIGTTGTPTIIFNPRFGASATPASNVALGASNTITLGNNLSSAKWSAEFVLCIRQLGIAASGSSGTGNGFVVIEGAAGAVSQCIAMGSTVASTLDHTTAQGLVLDVTWGTSSASNTITAQWTHLQSLN